MVATTRRRKLNPHLLAYLMGPAALVVILPLQELGAISRHSVWLWLAVFATIPAFSLVVDLAYQRDPNRLRLHGRVAWHAAAVTAVIYLSGWGPVLIGAFAFIALENISHHGSTTWRVTVLWSMVGIGIGQLGIGLGWFPSMLSLGRAEALGFMGAFVLVFVIRMAGANAEQKEDAESSLRTSEERFRSLVQHSSDTTLLVGADQRVIYASPATVALLGRSPDEVVGLSATDLMFPDDRERVSLELAARLQSDAVTEPVEVRMLHADGTPRDVEVVLSDLRDQASVSGIVANVRDVTDRKEAQDQLAHQAVHDSLTGLANRVLILDRAEQMLARGQREQHDVAALFIDIDNFKEVNDRLGHDAGDQILQTVALRFTAALRATDTIGRLGGDEFVVLTEGLSLAPGPEVVAQRLHDTLREPIVVDGPYGSALQISASIGIAKGVRDSAQELLRDADIALYRAKAMGKNCSAQFEPEMQSAILDRLSLKADLQAAIVEKQFFLLYQPLLDLDSMHIYGVEALLRWRHPTRGTVAPNEFVPMLEETGMIIEVGRWVLREACRQTAEWNGHGHRLAVSVNISMRQLATESLILDVTRALTDSRLEPHALVLEITETDLMRDVNATVGRLRKLKALGVRVAVDDFGTGYSSLAYLRQFPVDVLKIDRSFIAAMGESAESAALVHTMVELGRALGLETFAEGIEETSQLETLRTERCAHGQGFLFSKPISPAAIGQMLRQTAPFSEAQRIG